MKKLIILSIVLLTTLSATLLNKLPNVTNEDLKSLENKAYEKDNALVIKLKLFDAKEYMHDYERKKRVRTMIRESIKQD